MHQSHLLPSLNYITHNILPFVQVVSDIGFGEFRRIPSKDNFSFNQKRILKHQYHSTHGISHASRYVFLQKATFSHSRFPSPPNNKGMDMSDLYYIAWKKSHSLGGKRHNAVFPLLRFPHLQIEFMVTNSNTRA